MEQMKTVSEVKEEAVSSSDELITSVEWLEKYSLLKKRLDAVTLAAQIGLRHMNESDELFSKSKVKHGEQKLTDIGKVNVTTNFATLKQVEQRLQRASNEYRKRLKWLTSGSRRIFGIIRESRVTLILDIRNNQSLIFNPYIRAVEILINDQIVRLEKFNLICASEHLNMLSQRALPVTQSNITSGVDWIWSIKSPDTNAGASSTIEALLRANADPANEAVYLFTEGTSSSDYQMMLKDYVRRLRVPLNVVSYQCTCEKTRTFLKQICQETRGRFHAYTTDSYQSVPLGPDITINDIRTMRDSILQKDCYQIYEEQKVADKLVMQVKFLMNQKPDEAIDYESRSRPKADKRAIDPTDLAGPDWLAKFGLRARKLDLFDVIEGLEHEPCLALFDIPPDSDELLVMPEDPIKFPCCHLTHVRLRDGRIIHVDLPASVHRLYDQRMRRALTAIRTRVEHFSQDMYRLFGCCSHKKLYFLIDIGKAMKEHLKSVVEAIYLTVSKQMMDKGQYNLIAFQEGSANLFTHEMVFVNKETSLRMCHWLSNLKCTSESGALKDALRVALADPETDEIFLFVAGTPPTLFPDHVISLANAYRLVPVHCVACEPEEMDTCVLLKKLATHTKGCFHFLEPDEETRDNSDVKLLKREYELGKAYMDKMTLIRKSCHESKWRRKRTSLRFSQMKSSSGETHEDKKEGDDENDEVAKDVIEEVKAVEDEEEQEVDESDETDSDEDNNTENTSARKPEQIKKSRSSLRQWLDVYSLKAQHMTILDALDSVPKPEHRHSVDQPAVDQVVQEYLPLSQRDLTPRPFYGLLDRRDVDVPTYRKKLTRLLKKYTEKFLQLITEEEKQELLKSSRQSKLSYNLHHGSILKILKDSRWRVPEADVRLLADQIIQGRQYLKESKKLKKRTKEETVPFALSPHSHSETVSKSTMASIPSVRLESTPSTAREPKKKEKQQTHPATTMKGQPVIVEDEKNYVYYPAYVVNCPNAFTVTIEFGDRPGYPICVPNASCITMTDLFARPVIKLGDWVLTRVLDLATYTACYVPGVVVGIPVQSKVRTDYKIELFTGRIVTNHAADILKISKDRFYNIVAKIVEKLISEACGTEFAGSQRRKRKGCHRKYESSSISSESESEEFPEIQWKIAAYAKFIQSPTNSLKWASEKRSFETTDRSITKRRQTPRDYTHSPLVLTDVSVRQYDRETSNEEQRRGGRERSTKSIDKKSDRDTAVQGMVEILLGQNQHLNDLKCRLVDTTSDLRRKNGKVKQDLKKLKERLAREKGKT